MYDTEARCIPPVTAPCSAYCRPEEGIHVYIAFTEADNPIEKVRQWFAGTTRQVENCWGGESCYPLPATITIMSIDEAPECNEEPPPKCDLSTAKPLLMTIKVVD